LSCPAEIATGGENRLIYLERNVILDEEVFATFSFAPIRDDKK
jgi:hypothetical protein